MQCIIPGKIRHGQAAWQLPEAYLETLQKDLDGYCVESNTEWIDKGKRGKGKTPMRTFMEDKQLVNGKNITGRTMTTQLSLSCREDLATNKSSTVQKRTIN